MNIIQNGGLIARPLVVTDRPFLYKWLNDPFVLEFYEGRNRPHTMADIDENFYDNSEETRCIVEYDGVPIG
ncbi:MAG: Bifunctional AAC [bacterium ADurb.Bin243]|nr:MAG: Bifunctional AAC [bacterium ADurb.Bin243]